MWLKTVFKFQFITDFIKKNEHRFQLILLLTL